MWEYKVHSIKVKFGLLSGTRIDAGKMEQVLNRYGAEGWELVSVTGIVKLDGNTKAVLASFKRAVG